MEQRRFLAGGKYLRLLYLCLLTLFRRLSGSFEIYSLHIRCLLGPVIYLLTPWSRVLEKLTGSAASQEIPRIFGTRSFITVLTSARHLSLS